jgi:hypothetical protein
LIYEKRLDSFADIIKELSTLDLDAGIRAVGKYKAKKCFVFVTRSPNGFTSLLYSIKTLKKEALPDKRLLAKEFPDLNTTEQFLSQVVAKPVKASAY